MTSSASRPESPTATRHLPASSSVADGSQQISGTGFAPQVHQAAGILSVQLSCTIEDALTALHARASTTHRPVEAVAKEIVNTLHPDF